MDSGDHLPPDLQISLVSLHFFIYEAEISNTTIVAFYLKSLGGVPLTNDKSKLSCMIFKVLYALDCCYLADSYYLTSLTPY